MIGPRYFFAGSLFGDLGAAEQGRVLLRWKLEQAEDACKLLDTQTTGKAVILPS